MPLVQELHRRGLLVRHGLPADDRRSIALGPTRVGEAALENLLLHAMDHDRRLDEIVGDRKAGLNVPLKKIGDTRA
jgi:DNA-binding MarR family transcriptional regulator